MSSRNWNHKQWRNSGGQELWFVWVDRFRSHAKTVSFHCEWTSKRERFDAQIQFGYNKYTILLGTKWSVSVCVGFCRFVGRFRCVNGTHREHGNQNIAFINWLIKSLSHKIDLSNRMLFCTKCYTYKRTGCSFQRTENPLYWNESGQFSYVIAKLSQ